MRMNKAQPFMDVKADGENVPTFSERFLYDRIGKYEARFVLGVAEEYDHVIKALGPAAVKAILDVRPRLAQRLGTGDKVREWLEDARSDEDLRREEWVPSQVVLDRDAAEALWNELHSEYRRYFDIASMDADKLRAYNALTDMLGEHYAKDRKQADDERPAMREKYQGRQQLRADARKRYDTAIRALDRAEGDAVADALAEWKAARNAWVEAKYGG